MAASRLVKAFNRLLFPTFGGPKRTTRTPFFTISDRGVAITCRCMSSLNSEIDSLLCCNTFSISLGSISSSPKSITASTAAKEDIKRLLHCIHTCDPRPLAAAIASFLCSSVSERSRSARPSTCVRSIFPFINALLLNSPRLAGLICVPSDSNASYTPCTTAFPP